MCTFKLMNQTHRINMNQNGTKTVAVWKSIKIEMHNFLTEKCEM